MKQDLDKVQQDPSPPRRIQPWKLWKLLVAAFLAHLVGIAILSPGCGHNADKDPKVLLDKARKLREEKKFDLALEAYQMVVSQKPPVPAVFVNAEKEMHECRMEGLAAKREAQQEAEQEKEAEKPPTKPAPKAADKKPGEGESSAPVKLPELPKIEGEL